MADTIFVKGAKVHNLKNIDVKIPKNKLVVFTGVSGSGKTSLAMDTIYAEGQRRYVESLSAYARQFLGRLEKPDVEKIDGLSPAIAIDQKSASRNPRSTVGTITEVYDYLRLLFAKIGHPHCPKCGSEIAHQSIDQIVNQVRNISKYKQKRGKGLRLMILAPVIRDRKGEFSTLFVNLKKQGYTRARIDGTVRSLDDNFALIKTNRHTIEVIVDRIVIGKKQDKDFLSRLTQSLETSLKLAAGTIIVSEILDKTFAFPDNPKKSKDHLYSETFSCPNCNISLGEIEPRTFSFNSPHGACPECEGLGTKLKIDPELIYNPRLTILEGGIFPLSNIGERDTWQGRVLKAVANRYKIPLDKPLGEIPQENLARIFYGTSDNVYEVKYKSKSNKERFFDVTYEGIILNLERRYEQTDSDYIRSKIEKYMLSEPCPKCHGARLKDGALNITIDGKSIIDITHLSILECQPWVASLLNEGNLNAREKTIGRPIIKEILKRLTFLNAVGLDYLTIDRSSTTLASGEAQRIRLASQIGSGLSGVLYVLDEPSIGLHYRDQRRLIATLKQLRDLGNTVIVVEHDPQTILAADYILDFGPGAGKQGGEIIASGTPEKIMRSKKSLTGKYLSGKKQIKATILHSPSQDHLLIKGCSGHNLKNIDVAFPMNKLICVTGVSGSGKSTLINETLYRLLRLKFNLKIEEKPLAFKTIMGIEKISNVINIDQAPIGRTPRSNPATYTKAFDGIRELFSQTQEAKIRGYKMGRFSFNVKGGRCEACRGEGQIKIAMQFLPDIYVNCEVCKGERYNKETLEVEYKGKNITEVLKMTVGEALKYFINIPKIKRKLETLCDVGLSYLELGQSAPTLSGGEAQRIKLAAELSKRAIGNTLYIFDEPTTGLHFADLQKLINILRLLVNKGNTVIIIEHNLDVIKNADWLIDLGPEGGDRGGQIVAHGTLSDVMKVKTSYTGKALREILKDKG